MSETRTEMYQTVREALERIIARVALASPYYELARDAEVSLAVLEAQDREAPPSLGEEYEAFAAILQERATPPAPPAAECADEGGVSLNEFMSLLSSHYRANPDGFVITIGHQAQPFPDKPITIYNLPEIQGDISITAGDVRRWNAELAIAKSEIQKLHVTEGVIRQELEDQNSCFDLRWKADMRAIERWRVATGRTLVSPDHADLCVWLLEQQDAAKSEIARLTALPAYDLLHDIEEALGDLQTGALTDMPEQIHDLREDIASLAAELRQAVDALRPFHRVWKSRPPLDVTKPFRVDCEVGEYGAWADAGNFVAAYDAKHGEKA